MTGTPYRLIDLQPDDLKNAWLWMGVSANSDGALLLKPIKTLKTDKFSGRLIACEVALADGTKMWAMIEGLNPKHPEFSKHNKELNIWIENYGWFKLAQYFDEDALKDIRGDEVLCRILKKNIDEVFPIRFNVSNRAKTPSPCLIGAFEHNPSWGLTQSEVMGILVREL